MPIAALVLSAVAIVLATNCYCFLSERVIALASLPISEVILGTIAANMVGWDLDTACYSASPTARDSPSGLTRRKGEALITVSEHARELLKGYERPEGTALRLDPTNWHTSEGILARLGFGEPKEDDQVVLNREGEELLRIERSVSEELNGSEIDVVSTIEGPTLDLKRFSHTAWPLTDDS